MPESPWNMEEKSVTPLTSQPLRSTSDSAGIPRNI